MFLAHNRLLLGASLSRTVTMLEHVQMLGLESGLKLCLDAGDANSYNASVQTAKWLDTSGNGYDFYRGTSTGGDAAEPTFNGTAGKLSSSEYWSFDGGDYFLYDTTNETWMQNLHKDNAKFTFAFWYYPAGSTSSRIFGTGPQTTDVGFFIFVRTDTGGMGIQIKNGSGSNALAAQAVVGAVDGAWQFFAVSVDEAANTAILMRNGAATTVSGAYTSPSAASASYALNIGAGGNAIVPIANGGRLSGALAWEGVALDEGQLRALFHATRDRFGV